MKTKISIIIVFVMCFIVGTCLTIQTRSNDSEHAFVSGKILSDNEVSMQAEKTEIERLEKLNSEAEEKLAKYESEGVSGAEVNSTVNSNYDEMKLLAGCTNVKGPGIRIILDDGVRELNEGENANSIVVHDIDLMIIIDELVNAGAEAISINGERYISTTEMSCSGHTVKINGRKYARPFKINVIGDQSTLFAAMTIPGGYGDILKQYGLIFNVEKSDSIIIPAYDGDITMNYTITEEEV